ncbi:MAG TPA: lamin tail domain-containing protein [Vicinamibacterales bacterium]|nr:lamin tail domain-containing protein [Vicinamibacterales bacterium]
MTNRMLKNLPSALCLVLLAAASASAQPGEVFISEYIEGSSNNKAIEIYNGTGRAIDLAAGGYTIKMFFNGSATAGATITLTGTVAPGDVHVVAHASANAAILAQADQTTGASWYNGNDAVVLLKGTAVIDAIGQVGFDPGTEWGTGLTSTADNTLRRKASVCAGDTNPADPFDPAIEWDGYAIDTFAGLGAHTANCGPASAPVLAVCGAPLSLVQGTAGSRDVTASDADGTVVSLELTSVTPAPAAGAISRTAFTPALAVGGTATSTISVSADVPAGSYEALISAANSDPTPQTATCTLSVRVIQPVEIWEIQGAGLASPLEGQTVFTADNIVTALGYYQGAPNGFFMQTPDARADSSASTSNGIFVYTGGVPAVQVGDQVDVLGTVAEYFGLTELTTPTVTVDSSGHALPAAVLLGEIEPGVFVPSHSQPWPAIELERFEGMRVRVENGRAAAATDQYGDIAVVAASSRPFREPGIAYPGDPLHPIVWDGNPEIFEINPDGAGLANVSVPAGSVIEVAEGPLTYAFSSYQIWPTTFAYTAPALPRPVRARRAGEMTVATQNLLHFFDADTTNGPDDDPVSPAEYQARLAKASLYIRTVLGAPDVLCVQEAENLGVLEALAARIAADDPSMVYSAHLLEGHDIGGIDNGFLVRDTVAVDSVTQVGYDTRLSLDGSYLNDRPPLVLEGRYLANGAPFPITVIGVHGRSLSGIDGPSANRVRQKRLEQSLELASYIQGLQVADPARRIVVTGDFNAYQFSDGYVDVVGLVSGSLDGNGALQPGHEDLVQPDLYNVLHTLPEAERYSFVYGGSAQALDHALISASLGAFLREAAFARGNADAPASLLFDTSTAAGTSDHDGLVLFVMTDFDGDGVPDDEEGPAPVGADFNGDATSDILWRGAAGDLQVWGMSGGVKSLDGYVGAVADPDWEIKGQGDLDGDGTVDLLWRHKTDGTIYYWRFEGYTPVEELFVATVDPSYDIVGTGDFDGNGTSDILWRGAGGDLWMWTMDGASVTGEFPLGVVDAGYRVEGIGDLDADAKADIAWRGAAGDVWVWLMNGPVKRKEAYLATVDLAYEIQQVADFDGLGAADLLWWNATLGDVWIWFMNGTAVVSEACVGIGVDTDYRIVGAGDYNGDGKADILWHRAAEGDVWVWVMNGSVRASEIFVDLAAGPGYQVVK